MMKTGLRWNWLWDGVIKMSEFTAYDFSESVAQADGFGLDDIKECIAAWGYHGDYAEWHGGFLLRLNDGRLAYIEGWCDTTGWGCQDGCETRFIDSVPTDLNELLIDGYRENIDWSPEPADANRLIRGEIDKFD